MSDQFIRANVGLVFLITFIVIFIVVFRREIYRVIMGIIHYKKTWKAFIDDLKSEKNASDDFTNGDHNE